MGYWHKKKYATVDENHVIFNFKLKKLHFEKIDKRRRKKYGSLLKYQQVKEYAHRRYYNFRIGIKLEKKFI